MNLIAKPLFSLGTESVPPDFPPGPKFKMQCNALKPFWPEGQALLHTRQVPGGYNQSVVNHHSSSVNYKDFMEEVTVELSLSLCLLQLTAETTCAHTSFPDL